MDMSADHHSSVIDVGAGVGAGIAVGVVDASASVAGAVADVVAGASLAAMEEAPICESTHDSKAYTAFVEEDNDFHLGCCRMVDIVDDTGDYDAWTN
mmetsp:Transcript_30440/g.51916  ORF Transcript_30440/g.51916 Transcript_30440/m.51916 type:complete len:97 (+) Transcript_30440:277-567(+)